MARIKGIVARMRTFEWVVVETLQTFAACARNFSAVLAGVGWRIPGRRRAAAGAGPPDDALERIRDAHIAGLVKGQGIQAR